MAVTEAVASEEDVDDAVTICEALLVAVLVAEDVAEFEPCASQIKPVMRAGAPLAGIPPNDMFAGVVFPIKRDPVLPEYMRAKNGASVSEPFSNRLTAFALFKKVAVFVGLYRERPLKIADL